MRVVSAVVLCLCLLALGCVDDPKQGEPAQHAPTSAVPGSHEDWCAEHGVPESQCTRCDPDLIAAFRATGDWCDEHGLPESQCLACKPGIKLERPPKPGAR